MVKPSNAQLANSAAEQIAAMFYEERGYGLSVSEQNDMEDAIYRAFNAATVAEAKERKCPTT